MLGTEGRGGQGNSSHKDQYEKRQKRMYDPCIMCLEVRKTSSEVERPGVQGGE